MTTTSSIVSRILDHHDLRDARVVDSHDVASFESIEQAARALDLEARAGLLRSYEALVRVDVLPAVVSLRQRVSDRMFALREDGALDDVGREWCLEILHGADETGVELEHPERGRHRMARADFEAAWRGAILCIAGAPRPPGLVRRIRRARPPALAVVVAAAVAVLGIGAWLGPAVLALALGGAAAASVWATLGSRSCAACDTARRQLGLSLGPVGVAGYGLLLAAVLALGPAPAVVLALFAASGVHVALVTHLASHRLRCGPCLATAGAAWLAAGTGVAPAVIAVAAVAAIATRLALDHAAHRAQSGLRDAVRGILGERRAPSGVTMVVYKLDGCAACQHVQDVVLPALAQRLGDRLTIELRPLQPHLPAPTIAVLGARGSVALLGVPDAVALEEALAV